MFNFQNASSYARPKYTRRLCKRTRPGPLRRIRAPPRTSSGRVHVCGGAYKFAGASPNAYEWGRVLWLGRVHSRRARTPLPGARTSHDRARIVEVMKFLLEIRSPWLNTVESGFGTIPVHTHYFSKFLIIRISLQRPTRKRKFRKIIFQPSGKCIWTVTKKKWGRLTSAGPFKGLTLKSYSQIVYMCMLLTLKITRNAFIYSTIVPLRFTNRSQLKVWSFS